MNLVKRKHFLLSLSLCLVMAILAFTTVSLTQQTTSAQAATTDLNFSLYINNGEQEYRVSALNKSLTKAVIPSHYNGLPVTEIADSGFMACGNLEYVFIPTTVKRIGNNAFMNDAKLKRIVGMPKVTIIGNNAFAMCSNLEYLILPGGLSTLGSNVIRNTINPVYARASAERMALLNPNWNYNGNIVYGNEIVYRDYTNEQGVNGYEIAPYQIFEQEDWDLTLPEPLVIYSWCYENIADDIGAPLLNIAEGAFAMSTVPSITIKHPEGSDLSHIINIESDAFSSVDAEYISIEVEISLKNNVGGESTGVFYGSSFQSITLPDSLNTIPDRTFAACENLTEIKNLNSSIETNQLSAKILTIGDDAFNNTKLPELYIQNTIEYIGSSAFNQWGTTEEQLLSIDIIEEDADNWSSAWRSGINETGTPKCIVDFTGALSFAIEFTVEQTGVLYPVGNDTLQIDRNEILNNVTLPTPSSVSHNFTGVWYTTENRVAGTEFDLTQPIKKNLTLYAGWEIKSFDIEFTNNKYLDFKDIDDNIITGTTKSYNYGEIIRFFIIIKDGYKNPTISFNGGVVTPNSSNLYTITIIEDADFSVSAELIEYTITYANLRSGTNPNAVTTYTVESATINFAAPVWDAYDGKTWDTTSIPSGSLGNKTITAIWTNPVTFTITYANLRSGTNPNIVTTYTVESATINFAAPVWDAYSGKTWNITSIPNGSWGNKTITAVWSNPVTYTITYANLRSGTNPSSNPTTYNVETAAIAFANPTWAAYSNGSWNTTSIPSGSWGNKTITAIWSNPITFTITYSNLQSGTHTNTVTSYNIDSNTITFANPSWAAYNNGTWNTTSIPNGSWGNKTITAVWSNPVTYTITYANVLNGTNPSSNPTTYNVETATITFAKPTWTAAYNNGAWNTASIPKGSWGNKTITAVWTNPVTYYITYANLQNGTNPSSNPATYNIETATITFAGATRTGYPNCSWNITSIPNGSTGNKTITAVWSTPYSYAITYTNLQGGSNPNTRTSYTVEDAITFSNPSRPGYLGSWDIPSISKGSTGAKTITAVWENFEYTVEARRYCPECNQLNYGIGFKRMSADVSWSFTAKDKCENNKGGNGLLTCALIFSHWEILQGAGVADPNWKCYDKSFSVKNFTTVKGDEIIFVAIYKYPPDSGTCVAEGTMITLADGSQKAVESLTGDELLLVWNHRTGTFDAAPITFVQSNALSMYELIHLYFSDGTEIKVSYEHAFWDFNLNRYVMIRNGEAEQYIGHWFNKQITDANGNMTWTKVQLISVEVYTEYLRVYSPVTFAHLNFYVNGLLSMPGDTEGLINIFEMDADTLQYNQDAMTADIELYGLFEYADFADMIPEEIFEAFQVQYLSISLGKGLITWDRIEYLIGEFAAYWDAI